MLLRLALSIRGWIGEIDKRLIGASAKAKSGTFPVCESAGGPT